jgi:DNA-binding MarR family transcriptional regulator
MHDSITHLLHRANQVANERYSTKATTKAGTARQHQVLAAIASLEAPSQSDLVDATKIDRSTMADVVRRLCTLGLVKRKRTKQDARRYALALTDAGEAALETSRREAAAGDSAVLELVPVRLRGSFETALRSIARAGAQLEAAE